MRFTKLRDENNDRLILIFAGWSSGASLYRKVAETAPDGWDVAVASDFAAMGFDVSLLSGYSTVYLFAWSLGVAWADVLLPPHLITTAVAVNGTSLPADDNYGIPRTIFAGTAAGLSPSTLEKFRRRMAGSYAAMARLEGRFDDAADIESLRTQLLTVSDTLTPSLLKRHDTDGRMPSGIRWSRVYIGTDDRIFPANAQQAYWRRRLEDGSRIVVSKTPHLMPLEEIVAEVVPDPAAVGRSFSNALVSYDDHATAQSRMARHLAIMLGKCDLSTVKRALEVGPGSGNLSRLWLDMVSPEAIDFIDLYPLPVPLRFSEADRYYATDAERWILTQPDNSYDLIISGAAIQWMSNPINFLTQAARCLRTGGVLCCSTFAPGNLRELDTVRPAPIIYPPADDYRERLSDFFSIVTVEEEDLTLTFSSSREALFHLRQTGTAPRRNSATSLAKLLKALTPPRLTYRPLYILARK